MITFIVTSILMRVYDYVLDYAVLQMMASAVVVFIVSYALQETKG